MNRRLIAACVLLLLASVTVADAQVVVVNGRRTPSRRPQFRIQEVEVNATVKDQAATVQMAQVFENQSSFTIETQFLFPLPDGAAISGLTLVVDGKELTGKLSKKEDARRVYENIVRQQKDPALLEYIGDNVFKDKCVPDSRSAETTRRNSLHAVVEERTPAWLTLRCRWEPTSTRSNRLRR